MAGNYPYKDFPAPDPGPQPYYPDGQGFCLNKGDEVVTRFGEFSVGETAQMQSTLLRIRNERLHGGNTGLDISGARTDGITHALFDNTCSQVAKIEVYDESIAEFRYLPLKVETAEFPFGMARPILLTNPLQYFPHPSAGGAVTVSFEVWWKYLMAMEGQRLDGDDLWALFENATRIQPHAQIEVRVWDNVTHTDLMQEKYDPYVIDLYDNGALQIEARTEDQIPLPATGGAAIDDTTDNVSTMRAWFVEPSIFYIGRSKQHFSISFIGTPVYDHLCVQYNTTDEPNEYFAIGQTVRLAANDMTVDGGAWFSGVASTTRYVEGVIVDHYMTYGIYTAFTIAQLDGSSPDPSEAALLSGFAEQESVWMWDTSSEGMSETTAGDTGSDPLFNFAYGLFSCLDEGVSTRQYREQLYPASNWQHPSDTPWDLAPTIRKNFSLRPESWGSRVHMLYSGRNVDPGNYMHTYLNKVTVDMKSPNARILIDNIPAP